MGHSGEERVRGKKKTLCTEQSRAVPQAHKRDQGLCALSEKLLAPKTKQRPLWKWRAKNIRRLDCMLMKHIRPRNNGSGRGSEHSQTATDGRRLIQSRQVGAWPGSPQGGCPQITSERRLTRCPRYLSEARLIAPRRAGANNLCCFGVLTCVLTCR